MILRDYDFNKCHQQNQSSKISNLILHIGRGFTTWSNIINSRKISITCASEEFRVKDHCTQGAKNKVTDDIDKMD